LKKPLPLSPHDLDPLGEALHLFFGFCAGAGSGFSQACLPEMPSDAMIPLLALQVKDLELRKATQSLKSFPPERKKLEGEIEAAKSALEEVSLGVKNSEVERQRMEDEVEAAQEKIRKLKNQQLDVRKNEEYEALSHEIAALEKKVEEIEDRELVLLDSIDAAQTNLEEQEKVTASMVERLKRGLEKIDADEQSLREQLAGLEKEVEARRDAVDAGLLETYDSLWAHIKRPPVVVPLKDQQCGGCHLRVSNEIEAAVQAFKPIVCDQCGRLLFVE